jgi:putative flippase GtrA
VLKDQIRELFRYVVNGLAATLVHYGILVTNLELLRFPSAAAANVVAACFGISASFLGNRYFVFRNSQDPVLRQMARFGALYAAIAVLHGLVLLVWSDLLGFDYRLGFLLATGLQFLLSYLGNKFLVFRYEN